MQGAKQLTDEELADYFDLYSVVLMPCEAYREWILANSDRHPVEWDNEGPPCQTPEPERGCVRCYDHAAVRALLRHILAQDSEIKRLNEVIKAYQDKCRKGQQDSKG